MSKEYIKREDAKARLRIWITDCVLDGDDEAADCFRGCIDLLDSIPAADVTPVVHGRWIEDHDYLKCPECSVMVKRDFTFFDIGDWNYCPNCGAYMMGENNGKCE